MFRWAKNGFVTDKQWLENATPQDLEQREIEKRDRWQSAVASFTTLEKLDKTSERTKVALYLFKTAILYIP